MASDIFSISLTSAGLITVRFGTGIRTTSAARALSAGTWSQVTVSFILQTIKASTNLLFIYINGVADIKEYGLTVGTITFTPSTDVVRIGGPNSFLGSFKQLSIYSPGSLQVNSRNFYLKSFFVLYIFSLILFNFYDILCYGSWTIKSSDLYYLSYWINLI